MSSIFSILGTSWPDLLKPSCKLSEKVLVLWPGKLQQFGMHVNYSVQLHSTTDTESIESDSDRPPSGIESTDSAAAVTGPLVSLLKAPAPSVLARKRKMHRRE